MPLSVVLISVGLGLAAGVLSGLFGIGGGVIIVPALVLLLGLPQKTATGTSLLALLLPVASLAVYSYAKENHLNVKVGLLVALGLFLGSVFGARLALGASDVLLRRGFALLLVLTAVRLAFTR